jgi:hypothetical protein
LENPKIIVSSYFTKFSIRPDFDSKNLFEFFEVLVLIVIFAGETYSYDLLSNSSKIYFLSFATSVPLGS